MSQDNDPFRETYTLLTFSHVPARASHNAWDDDDQRIVKVTPRRRWMPQLLLLVAVGLAARLLGMMRTA